MLLAQSTPATAALKPETSTIPIVFAGVADPIGSGFVASLSRPNGNLTGLLQYEEGITGKWLAMLKEIAPNLTRAALLANPRTAAFDYFLRSAKTLAPSLAIEVVPMPIENANDIERSIEGFAREPNGGLVLPPDTTTVIHRDLIIPLAARHRLPAVYAIRVFVSAFVSSLAGQRVLAETMEPVTLLAEAAATHLELALLNAISVRPYAG